MTAGEGAGAAGVGEGGDGGVEWDEEGEIVLVDDTECGEDGGFADSGGIDVSNLCQKEEMVNRSIKDRNSEELEADVR